MKPIRKYKVQLFYSFLALGIAFLLASLLMPLCNGLAMKVSTTGEAVYNHYGNTFCFFFGLPIKSEHTSYNANGFTLPGLVGYILMMVSVICLVSVPFVSLFKKNISHMLFFVSCLLLFSGALMMFFNHRQASNIIADNLSGKASGTFRDAIYEKTSLGFGFIGTGIFGIVSSMFSFLTALMRVFFLNGKEETIQETEKQNKKVDFDVTSSLRDDDN